MVETAVSGTRDNLYKKVLSAAMLRNDTIMLQRLHGIGPDLVAAEARYHQTRNCLSNYINTELAEIDSSAYMEVLKTLISEYQNSILCDKEVYLLSTLKKRYHELAESTGISNPHLYSAQNLKLQLQKNWPELSFISQPGMSDFVCVNTISVGDALSKIHNLSVLVQNLEEESEFESQISIDQSDDSIIHRAIGILREKMKGFRKLDDEYYSSQEMSNEDSRKFVDPLLYKAVGWLTDETLYNTAADINEWRPNTKVLSIVCDIIALSTSVMSPKHLGLATHLHHEYGSRKLVDTMNSLGYSISYTELRRFLTSVAVHITSGQDQGPAGSLIPPELVSKDNGGQQIIAVGDNWDHNERTVDGKRTTHAMTIASIIVTPLVEEVQFARIPRVASRTFDISSLPGKNIYVYILFILRLKQILRLSTI